MKLVENVEKYLSDRADLLAQRISTDFICEFIEELEEKELDERPVNSPVEQLFLIEWKFNRVVRYESIYFDFDSRFELKSQVKNSHTGKYILDFQVDFFCGIMNSYDSKYYGHEREIQDDVEMPLLGIEIDGHIWHEKTKEQVRRDKERERFLVAKGWKLLRFTGSEVFNNPLDCINETLSVACSLSNKYKKLIDSFLKEK